MKVRVLIEAIESSVLNSKYILNQFHAVSGKLKLPFILLAFPILFSLTIAAQVVDEPPADVAPPSIRKLSKDEKAKLESETRNVKKRTKISIEMMDLRIVRAEKFHTETSYKESLDELAGFQAILDNLLEFLLMSDANDRRFIDFEIYLRKQIPRLETIRREMPFRYSFHVGKLMKSVRDARSKAVEPIFDDTVVPTAQKKPL